MDDDDLAAAATAIDPGSPPPVQELAASAPALPVDNAASTAGETLAVDPPTAAAAGDGEQVPFDEEKVYVPAEAIPQEADSTSADEQVPVAAEAVLEEAASAAVDEAHEDEDPVRGDANPASEGGVAKGDSRDGGAYISLVSLGVGGDVGAEIDDLVGEGTGIPDAVEAMPTTPDIVLDADGDGEALDGEGDKSDEYAKASGDDMVVKELVGVAEDSAPADITKADESDEDAGVGVQLDGINVAMDDSTELGASLVGVDSNMVSNRGGASFDDQTGQEIGGGAHDDADEDDGPRMDKNTPVSDDGEDSQDEQGAQMDVVATTVLSGVEAELVKAGDDVAGEGTNMDTLAPTGDDSEEEGVAMAGVTATDEEGRQMDAVAMTRDGNEEKATGKDGVDATDEDIRVDTIGLTGDDNEEKEVAAAGDDGADEEGMQMDAVTSTGDEDEEDGMAGQNVAEEADSVPEEAEVGTVGNDIPEEEAVQIDDDEEPPPLTRKGGGRRKRGRPSSKAQAVVKPSVKRKDDEEVCFICFDGGDLVVCDRRGCPKAYHPSCVNRDDEFFKSKGRWNCGWHICSSCQKPAHHMCYTCTYSLCKVCIKESKFVCVRGNKGFCETCMNTVMLIENKEEATEQMDVDFDDKSSWWYLFKDYWLNLKTKLSLTLEEISAAKSRKNGSSLVIRDNDLSELPDTDEEEEANSDSSSGCHLESNSSKKRGSKRSKHAANEDSSNGKESTRKSTKRGLSGSRDAKNSTGRKVRKLSKRASSSEHRLKESKSVGSSTSLAVESSWASKELLDFVAHMRNGDKSVLSQFDVQALLLEYIKRNKLRDPHRKSQIVCDKLLQNLFGKIRVGHFEMLKLLESHFLMSEVSPIDIDGNHGGVVDPDPSQDADGNSEASVVMSSEKRKKSRKYDQRALQTNLDDYAAIDNHNISLMYLRRNLIEELISDVDTFNEKVLGSFVRIRISGTGQRQDIYRLVQIVGTGTAAEKYKCGKKTTDITLEILNLDKREVITIDITSNQEFTEEECKRLRQSIKCGFIPRLTVGEVQEKARVLQAVKVNDWIESEKMRLGHLRDRASDMGRRKELRECVEKLQLLSTPEEHARRLNEEPEIHADPTMDPDYESPEEQEQDTERSSFNKSRGSFFRKDSNPVSPSKGEGRNAAQRDLKTNWESNRNAWGESTTHIESPLGRRSTFSPHGESSGYTGKSESPNVGVQTVKMEATTGNAPRGLSGVSSETLAANVGSAATPASQSSVNESEKIWQYMDPSGKIQGPFSIVQLRKWNSSGYFPPSLKIWKSSEKQDDSILLTDALVGKFEKDLPPWVPPLGSSSQIDKTYLRSNSDVGSRPCSGSLLEESTKAGEQTSKSAVPNRAQSFSGRVGQRHDYDATNLGSTMIQSVAQGYYGMQNLQAAYATQQSLTGSWNSSSSQFGTTVNPMALSQPAMGGFSVEQNNAVAGNVGQLTPVPAPATASAEIVYSQLQSQNQIASVLPQRDGRLADGNDLKLGEDASHGRMRSSGEDLGPVGALPGAAQSNTQQLKAPADARNQLSTDASNSMMPSQLMSTPSAEPVQPSVTAVTGSDNQSSGWAMPAQVANTSGQAQGAGNMNWGAALQGNASMGWGMMGQTNMNMSWGAPAQGAASYNMGLTTPTQPNAVPNMGWVTPNPGNTNMNMVWAATQGQGTPNAATMMGAQMQGVAMAPWGAIAQGNTNSYPGWGAQVGNMNQNIGWGSVQGNPGPNPGNGSGQGNNNMNWNSPNGNPNWNNQQRDTGGRHSGHGDNFNGSDSGGRSWRSQSGDGGSWGHRKGVCWSFVDTGLCQKGDQCNFYHPQTNDGYPSRNDRHVDRQTSSKERRYDRHNERNDRQFDRQPSGNERHYDRHDDRHSDRDNNRNDDRQADR